MYSRNSKKRVRRLRRLQLESLCRRDLLAGDMTNPVDPLDVNADDQRSPRDVIAIINYLGRQAEAENLPQTTIYPDTNADGQVTPSDALRVINGLAAAGEDVPRSSTPSLVIRGGDSPTVTIPSSNTSGVVTIEGDGTIIVSDVDGNEVTRESFGAIPNVLTVRLTGHENQLTVNGLTTRDDLHLEDEGVGNVIVLNNALIGDDFRFEGNSHDNWLELNDVAVADIFEYHGGRGDDLLRVEDVSVGDDFKFFGDDQSDALIAINTSIGDDAIVRTGEGNDLLAITGVGVNDVADIQGNRDSDTIIANAMSLSARDERLRGFELVQSDFATGDEFEDQVQSALAALGISRNRAPMIESITDPSAVIGVELVVNVTATDRDEGQSLTFALAADGAPASATITPTGETTATIRWTPSAADLPGPVTFTVQVSDDDEMMPLTATETFEVSLTVADAVEIESISPAEGEEMVNVARETIVRFDGEIDAASVTEDSFYVIANSERVPGRVVVSSTNRFATYFYDEALPPSTEVRVMVDGDAIKNLDGIPIDADGDLIPGGVATADFSTLPLTRIPGTNVFGFVRDSATGEPLVGVTIRVDAFPGLEAVTVDDDPSTPDINEAGRFELVDVPAPEFFVTIDGSTVSGLEDGLTYPTLGKPFKSTPGVTTQLNKDGVPHDIFLPLFPLDDVQSLSSDEPTDVGFGEAGLADLAEMFPDLDPSLFEEFRVTFEPGSARDDAGNAATEAVVIPVQPDRLPAPLPVGVSPPLVVSIQAGIDGDFNSAGGATNFDVPAAVTFPNVDGLAPGEKTLIFSFDHDAGDWIVNGTATVSEDGLSIVSDPGTGILAPGWHGTNPGTEQEDESESHSADDLADPAFEAFRNTAATLVSGTSTLFNVADTFQDFATLLGESVPGVGSLITSLAAIPDLALETITAGLDVTADLIKGGEVTTETLIGIGNGFVGDIVELTPVVGPAVGAASETLGLGLSAKTTLTNLLDAVRSLGNLGSGVGEWALKNGEDIVDRFEEFVEETQRRAEEAIDAARRAAELVERAAEAARDVYDFVQDVADFIDNFGTPMLRGASGEQITADLAEEEALTQLLMTTERAQASVGLLVESGDATIASASLRGAMNAQESVNEFGDAVEFGTVPTRSGFFRIELDDGQVLRGTIGADGRIVNVLPPNRQFPVTIFDAETGFVAETFVLSGDSGSVARNQRIVLGIDSLDSDGDGIPDLGELAIGTLIDNPDTDGDGISDAAELEQGLNPLDGVSATTGVQASLEMPGTVQAIATEGDLLFAATGSHGLSIVDATSFSLPIQLGQLDLPGSATDVGVDTILGIAAVATGTGLHLVDVSDPMMPALIRRVGVGASQVDVFGGFAFATSGNGLNVIDLVTGDVVSALALPGAGNVTGLAREGTTLYAYVSGSDTLAVVDISRPESPAVLGQTSVGIASTDVGISAGNGLVWLAGSGLRTVDVSDPTAPQLQHGADNFFTASRVALNGSGVGLVLPDGGSFVQLYDTSDPDDTDALLTQFELGGNANAVAISRGIGFIGAGNRLEVVNYRPFDSSNVAPTASLSVNAEDVDPDTPGVQVFEGGLISVNAAVTDDVQVRDVALLLNGDVVATDVSFPFDFVAPVPAAATGESFTVQIRASDTGGNTTTSDPITLAIVPDTFAPVIESVTPPEGASRFFGARAARVRFNEPIEGESLDASAFRLVAPGANGTFGDDDDFVVPSELALRDDDQLAQVTATESLPVGEYLLEIDESLVADRSGNVLGDGIFSSRFSVIERPSVDDLFDLVGEEQPGPFVLDGNDVQLGINADGSFIGGGVGLEFAGTDFLEPGDPLASYTIAFDGTNFTNGSPSVGSDFAVTLSDLSAGDFHGVRAEGIIGDQLRVERVAVFNEGEQFITLGMRLTNVGDATLANVGFLENHDPDQGTPIGVGADTTNDVVLDGELGLASVVNADFPAGLTMGFGSGDPRATVSIEQFFVGDPFDVINSPVDPEGGIGDTGLNLAFDLGDLAPGESASLAFAIVLARSTDEAIAIYQSTPFALP
ncbi:MAG: Ig-like domain-containing protein [Planctomycetota bacterium]